MSQKDAWEAEYQKPKLLKIGQKPRVDLLNYLKFLKKKEGLTLENLTILDLGSGNGKNANYLASLGNQVFGLEISPTAMALAQKEAKGKGLKANYQLADIGREFPFVEGTFDLVLDIMTSNSLTEAERENYLTEVSRVLKPGGYFFLRALCLEGDKNAKNLLKLSPGPEYHTYINQIMNLTERVFTEKDLRNTYGRYFNFQKLIKKTNYAEFQGQLYKRNYWLAYLRKL